ncbi:MAG TPA: histidinol phosphate phosphatase, partial [Erysipelotrichaceae bacterium]|nr:histidinol phosphate phosphatase [Erysipelotrichaceae bacterium]
MKNKTIDGHVHLENGPLTKEYVWEFVRSAQKKGIETLQILDHTHRFYEFHDMYKGV